MSIMSRHYVLAAGGTGGHMIPAHALAEELLAARRDRIPTLLHEQNAVLGRVNRLMAGTVDAIATAYPAVQRLPAKAAAKTVLVGNPVRDEVLALRDQPFPPLTEDGIFRLLVIGGSQGASILSEMVPEGLALLPEHFRRRLQVTQQCRAEDIEQVRARYARLAIPADLATYIPDLPDRLAWAHLVIARAGASTIAELTAAGRPAILVPLPSATDDHQTYNAREMAKAGGARVIAQSKFTAVELAKQMQKLGLEPAALTTAASRAKSVGRPNAAKDLADLVERAGQAPDAETVYVDQPIGGLAMGAPA